MSGSSNNDNVNSIQNNQSRFQFIPDNAFRSVNPDTNGMDPQRIISLLWRYKWLVMLFIVGGAAGAWHYSEGITPTYESNGILLISPYGAFANDELSQIISQATGYGTSSTLYNELQVLQSRKFSRTVARKLIEEAYGNVREAPLLWMVDENGRAERASEEVVASRINKRLGLRQPQENADVIEISFKSTSPEEVAKVVNTAMELYVENSTRQNRQAAESTAEFLEKEKTAISKKLQDSEDKLRDYMDATGIVQVDEQASGMVTQSTQLEAELQSVNLDLETVEQTIANYENQLERIKPGLSEQFSEAIGPRIRNSQEELAGYERERMLIITKNPGILDRVPLPDRLQFVNNQITRLKSEIKDLSDKLFTDNNEFLGLDGEDRAALVSSIQNSLVELRIEQNQYRSRRDAITQFLDQIKTEINSLPEGMIELAKLNRDVRINEDLYLNVSRQYADMSVWKQSQFGFGRIVDPGEIPAVPVSPNKKLLLLVGVMLGGFLVAGLIAVREFSDNSVKSVDQLRTLYLPTLTLSLVPSFEKVSKKNRKLLSDGKGRIPNELVMLQDRTSLASESIRRLKNSIIYQHGNTPPRTIAITSPEKGDGKSVLGINLGIAFAEEGYRTLLIDADFRQPMIRNYLGISGGYGFTDYLSGEITIQQLIQNSELNTLKVILAGRDISKPEIISNSIQFMDLVKKMEKIFDVIILDTPPFGIISDSTAVLKRSEATVLVARYRKTNRGMLLKTIDELDRIQANVTAIVLNDFDHRKEVGQYYGAGYYRVLENKYEAYVKRM